MQKKIRISKKQLKRNELFDRLSDFVDYMGEKKESVKTFSIIAVVVLVVITGTILLIRNRAKALDEEFYLMMAVYNDKITRADTEAEKGIEDSAKKLQEFYGQHQSGEFGSQALFALANSFFALKKYDDAILKYKQYIDRFPKSEFLSAAYEGIGNCYEEKKDYDNALKYFNDGIKLFKNSYLENMLRLDIARCYEVLKQYGDAKSQYETIVRNAKDKEKPAVKEAEYRIRWLKDNELIK